MSAQRCPYCDTWHPTAAKLAECADACFETRVKPLGHVLMVAVLQSQMTLEEAERVALSGK